MLAQFYFEVCVLGVSNSINETASSIIISSESEDEGDKNSITRLLLPSTGAGTVNFTPRTPLGSALDSEPPILAPVVHQQGQGGQNSNLASISDTSASKPPPASKVRLVQFWGI